MKRGTGIKLHVYVDEEYSSAESAILVVVDKKKKIADLKDAIEEKYNYSASEQHWIINHTYCQDSYVLEHAVFDMDKLNGVYIAFLFVISEENKNNLPRLIISYLENKYKYEDYREFVECPLQSTLVITQYIPYYQAVCPTWSCEKCTMNNKFFMSYCKTCGYNVPVDYIKPTDYYLNPQDKAEWEAEIDREEKAREDTEKATRKRESDMVKYRKRLEDVSKQDLIMSVEKTECPICLSELDIGEGVVLHSCAHILCRDCLRNEILVNNKPKVTCPMVDCFGIVHDREKAVLLSANEFKKYHEISMKAVEATMRNVYHCKTENCPNFFINEIAEGDRANIVQYVCTMCHRVNCLNCGAIHEGLTCGQYQNNPTDVYRKDLATLEQEIHNGTAQRCPYCNIIIKKRGGCLQMTCNNCRRGFKWTGQNM